MYTLTVALSLLKTQYQTNYGLIMAGATVSFIFPFIMYVFLQKQFVELKVNKYKNKNVRGQLWNF